MGLGLQKLGVKAGDSLLVFTPNHIFVPVAYLGTVCLGCAFSGASPAFTVAGRLLNIKAHDFPIYVDIVKRYEGILPSSHHRCFE